MSTKRGTSGRLLVCTDFFNCSLPTREQNPDHMRSYHDPEPFLFHSRDPSQPSVYFHRDPNRRMLFACSHPDCDHITMTTRNARRHYRTCQFLRPGRLAITTTITAATNGRSEQAMQRERQSQRQSPYVSRPRYDEQGLSSPSPSFTSLSSPEESDLDFDSGGPSTGPTINSTTMTAIKSNNVANAAASAPPSAILDEVLEAMSQLTDTVTEFSKHLDAQSERMDEAGERMDWFVAQIYEIRGQNAMLEADVESMRINMGLVEDQVGDLLRDNRRVKEEFESVWEEIGRVSLSVKYLGR